MKLLFYGRLADAIGRELEIDAADGCTIAELRKRLILEHPTAAPSLREKRVLTCVGDRFVGDSVRLRSTDQVEFMPPVSGG